MSERSKTIFKLKADKKARWAYIKAKLGVLVPSQIRALRLTSNMPRQNDLAKEAAMQQSRISMLERPGEANVTLETLAWLAAVFKVGLVVKFVPFSEMLRWENAFSQDKFNVIKLDEDVSFLAPAELGPLADLAVASFEREEVVRAGATTQANISTDTHLQYIHRLQLSQAQGL